MDKNKLEKYYNYCREQIIFNVALILLSILVNMFLWIMAFENNLYDEMTRGSIFTFAVILSLFVLVIIIYTFIVFIKLIILLDIIDLLD